MRHITRLALAATTAGAAAFGAVATVGPASAAPVSSTFTANASTVIKKMNTTVTFPTATQISNTDVTAQTVTGSMTLPATTATANLGFASATIGLAIVNPSAISGTAVLSGLNLNLKTSQSFQIQITSVSPDLGSFGSSGSSGAMNLLSSSDTCETPQTTATLTGSVNALSALTNKADFHVTGSYAIPEFSGCGELTSLINSMVAGSGNTLDVHLVSKA